MTIRNTRIAAVLLTAGAALSAWGMNAAAQPATTAEPDVDMSGGGDTATVVDEATDPPEATYPPSTAYQSEAADDRRFEVERLSPDQGYGGEMGMGMAGTRETQQNLRIEQEIRSVLEALPELDSADRKATARQRLQELPTRQFEARQRSRDLEIGRLEAEVRRLRDLHERREAAKDEIVRARLDQLIRSAEGLGWDGGGVVSPGRSLTIRSVQPAVDSEQGEYGGGLPGFAPRR